MQPKRKRFHFIAIGGSVMHNLAMTLKDAGHDVSGSDDDIFEPSRSNLAAYDLLPAQEGWQPEKIDTSIDTIILGMHAREDNPELQRAQQLGIPVMSFPEFIYNQSKNKQRIVIAGSHGKTTITAIIAHVLNSLNRKFDYVIGASVKGLKNTVKLSDAPVIIIEGDEYLSSSLDPTPKFLHYQHHIGLISGIAWDHANVFPNEEEYVKQFDIFADQTPKGGSLYYCEQDPLAVMICKKERNDVNSFAYKSHPHKVRDGRVYLTDGGTEYPINIFGTHNYFNLNGAKELLKRIGVTPEQFFEAISSFEGAAGRLEKVFDNGSYSVYKDFAHAPSKVKASVKAVKELNPKRELVACVELHTFSSLNKDYLPQYKNSLKHVQQAFVYFDPEKVKAKRLTPLHEDIIKEAFGSSDIRVFTHSQDLEKHLTSMSWTDKNLLMMSSGNFGDINIKTLAQQLKA